MQVHERITVNRPREEVYAFWRNFNQLPSFMDHLVSVSGDPDGITHWKAKAPTGTVEWDAKIVEDEPGKMISWRSLDDADVRNSGAVRFTDAKSQGTTVSVDLSYDPPLGALGQIVAKLFGDAPDQQISADLQRFKEIMESGQATVYAQADRETAAGRAELRASSKSTHAATNAGVYESDVDPQETDLDAADVDTTVVRNRVDAVTYPSTGVVGPSAAPRDDIVAGEPGGQNPGIGGAGVANDIDPDQLGLRTGKDQDKYDGNDRDADQRFSRRPSGAPL
jgi:uncharacterized protein YndB with AHSA1/START domain